MRSKYASIQRTAAACVLLAVITASGCLSGTLPGRTLQGANAIQVPVERYDLIWERAVAVLNNYHFVIARESKLEGVIETQYRAGSNLLEPWHHDSVGYASKLESTLQSIRRRVVVTFQNTADNMLIVSVRADKQIEDVPGLAANYEGGATFRDSDPLQRDLDQVVGQSGPSRWISRGTDPALEVELLSQIRHAVLR
ncbi:MAG: hypothetical protein GY758_35615 [Fuerstiella sp.]|nr:hypothetical protein [Fuerstiella sp.]MCP4512799.1 hypothetical protein [Fuerstiella sp.]MDG2127969.1 hypothetical protein [Fuerstiella sp.]